MNQYPYERNQIEFWKLAVGLALASLLIFANLYIVQPLLPIFSREFNVTPTLSSLSLSLTTLSLVGGLLFFGFLSDRVGRIVILRWTIGLSVIPLFVIPLYDAFWWLLVWRFITGFALAGLPAVGIAYINEEVSVSSRGLAVSLYIASNALGGMGGRVLGGYFSDHVNWQAGFYALGIISVTISLLSIWLVPDSRFFKRQNRSIVKDAQGMFVHFKNPLLLFAFIFGMMIQLSFSGIWTYIPFYLGAEPFLLPIRIISLIYFTYLFGVFGSPYAGRLAARFGIFSVMLTGLVIMIAGNLMTLIETTFFVVMGLSIVCLGFFIAHAMASTWVGSTAKHHKSGATSFYLISYYIGAALGGTAIGSVWSGFGWDGVIAVCTIFAAGSGLVFYWVVKEKREVQVNV